MKETQQKAVVNTSCEHACFTVSIGIGIADSDTNVVQTIGPHGIRIPVRRF